MEGRPDVGRSHLRRLTSGNEHHPSLDSPTSCRQVKVAKMSNSVPKGSVTGQTRTGTYIS